LLVDEKGNAYLKGSVQSGQLIGLLLENISTGTGVSITNLGNLRALQIHENIDPEAGSPGSIVLENTQQDIVLQIKPSGDILLTKVLFEETRV
jgi:hypothetical protein